MTNLPAVVLLVAVAGLIGCSNSDDTGAGGDTATDASTDTGARL